MSHLPRTKDEAIRGVKYQERLHLLHCRFYKNIRAVLTIISLASGSAAITAALQSVPGGVAGAALLVASMTIIDAVGNFSDKAAKHNLWRRTAALLVARSDPMDLAVIDAERNQLIADADDEIESLRAVAWNDVLRSEGMESAMRAEIRMEKIMRVMA